MPFKPITFGSLVRSLTALGYELVRSPKVFLFRHPVHREIFLPVLGDDEEVPGMSLAGIEAMLLVDGVIRPEGLSAMLDAAVERASKQPANGKKSTKTRAPVG
jgi:hypothetical protein